MKSANDAKLIKEITVKIFRLARENEISLGDMVTLTASTLVNLQMLAALQSLIVEFSHYATGSEDENETEAMEHARNLYKEITGVEP